MAKYRRDEFPSHYVGDLVPTERGWVVVEPTACLAGHPYGDAGWSVSSVVCLPNATYGLEMLELGGNCCVTIVFSLLSPVLLRVGFVDFVRGENLGHVDFSETGPDCPAASGGRCRMRNYQPVRSR